MYRLVHCILAGMLFFLLPGMPVASAQNTTPFTIANWNAALIRQAVTDLDLSGIAQEIDADIWLLQEVKQQSDIDSIARGLGLNGASTAISSFQNGTGNLEVGIISRFPLTNIVEFDQTPDGSVSGTTEQQLNPPNIPGIASRSVGRGFLVAEIPSLNTFVIVSHFKSSLGRSGPSDFDNAEKRELVAAAIVEEVDALLNANPNATIIFGGDVNVGVSDTSKNGDDLADDRIDGYDDTLAILGDGLVNRIKMRSLAQGLPSTFVGFNNRPRFPAAGAIDVLFIDGALRNDFTPAKVSRQPYGSDHLAVFASFDKTNGGGGATGNGGTAGGTTGGGLGGNGSPVVQIVNALPNPIGEDSSNEKVVLNLRGANTLDISDWRLRDRANNIYVFPQGTRLQLGNNELTLLRNTMPLNNNGDVIELFDVDGNSQGNSFSYSGSDVEPGEFVT